MRDQQRQRVGEPARQVLVGVDRDQPVDLERAADVDVADPGMGVRAAHERGRERVVAQVVEVGAVARGPAGRPRPAGPLAEQPGVAITPLACRRPCGSASLGSSAARSTDATMFGTRCSGTGCPPTISLACSCSGSGFVAQPGGDGGQEARRAEPALQAVAVGERLLHRRQRAVRLGQALDGGDLRAVGADREQEAGADRGAVQQDRAGAAHPVLAAHVGAGQPQVVAEAVGQQPPGRHPDPAAAPLTVSCRALLAVGRAVLGRPAHRPAPSPRARRGPPAAPRGQDPGQVPPVVGGGVDVGLGVDLPAGQVRGGGEAVVVPPAAAASVRSRTTGTARPTGSRPAPDDPAVPVQLDDGGHPAHRVVAAPPLTSANPVPAPAAAPGRGLGGELLRAPPPTPAARGRTRRRGPPLPALAGHPHRPVQHRQHRRHLPRRVGVHDAADGRAPVPDGRVGDAPQRLASSGWAAAAAGSASTWACRASAPTRTWPSSTRT